METITTPILDMLKIQHPVLLAGMNGVAGTLRLPSPCRTSCAKAGHSHCLVDFFSPHTLFPFLNGVNGMQNGLSNTFNLSAYSAL